MTAVNDYRFLNPWTLLLPQDGPCVLAVAGSGGKTTLLRRLLNHYRAGSARVMWTQTVAHPAPVDLPGFDASTDTRELRQHLHQHGAIFVGAGQGDDAGGVAPEVVDQLAASVQPDVVLVECHARTGSPLRADDVVPTWPSHCDRAFLTANLAAVGRPVSAEVIAGASVPPRTPGQEPTRVTIDDVLHCFEGPTGLLARAPASGLVVPFLTGFGSFRDMDGMFQAVQRLWESPRVRAVCLAELLGDPRRDEADRVGLRETVPGLSGERVYALYPAILDSEDQIPGPN